MEETKEPQYERPDEFWNRVYMAVVINTVIVVTLLWAFSKYFS